jgi:two-component system LytT family sensor kinase
LRTVKCCSKTLLTLESARKGEAVYYTFHAGLIDAAMPIMVNNQYIGSFLCGEVVLPETKLEFDDIKMRVKDLELDSKLLFDYLSEIEVVSKEKLIAALEMLTLMTNYIAEMGAANIAQKQLMAEMKAKAALKNMLKETEYKILQSQINPHFLFNCLNTIGRVALSEGAYQTQELIYAISDILRSLLKHPEKLIPITEEIKYVRDYLAIQLARFGDRFNVVYALKEEALTAKIPKFTLQPLIENAIIHGLEPKVEGGTLTINAVKQGDNIVIDVIDTGVGIQDAKLRTLINIKQEFQPTENFTNLGINNVHQRIQYYFGQDYGLKISSKPGNGCRVTITLPYINGD